MESFCLSEPLGAKQDDVPRLLRRLAEEIEKLGPDYQVWNVFVHRDEVNEHGDWPMATVFYDTKSDEESEGRHLRAVRPDR